MSNVIKLRLTLHDGSVEEGTLEELAKSLQARRREDNIATGDVDLDNGWDGPGTEFSDCVEDVLAEVASDRLVVVHPTA